MAGLELVQTARGDSARSLRFAQPTGACHLIAVAGALATDVAVHDDRSGPYTAIPGVPVWYLSESRSAATEIATPEWMIAWEFSGPGILALDGVAAEATPPNSVPDFGGGSLTTTVDDELAIAGAVGVGATVSAPFLWDQSTDGACDRPDCVTGAHAIIPARGTAAGVMWGKSGPTPFGAYGAWLVTFKPAR